MVNELSFYESKYNQFKIDVFECFKEIKSFDIENSQYSNDPKYGGNWYTWKYKQTRAIEDKHKNVSRKRAYIDCYVKCDFFGCDDYLKLIENE